MVEILGWEIEDIWHHVNGNKNEADAREYTHINNSDCLFTEAQKIRADYDKSVTNITALAKKLGYEWAVTTNGKVCPGYWAKIGTKATKPHVYADKRSHSKKKVSARGIIWWIK